MKFFSSKSSSQQPNDKFRQLEFVPYKTKEDSKWNTEFKNTRFCKHVDSNYVTRLAKNEG